MTFKIRQGDCLEVLKRLPDNSVDLIFTSPPYEAARTYGIDFKLKGQEFVDWALARYIECVRVSRGLVAWVIEGQTRQFQWSASPVLLMADLHRAGVKLRKPPLFKREGIPGSGGPDWWKNKYEFIICSSKGKLPWSDNTATGHPPIYGKGGPLSHQTKEGRLFNKQTRRTVNGTRGNEEPRRPLPELANPGNIIDCGSNTHYGEHAKENEAPFPEMLVEPFIKCFCPPGGVVLDPFMGSGTTLAVALKNGRKAMGIDLRDSQVDLTRRRLEVVQETMKNGQ